MKTEGNMITDWLNENRNPEIDKQVEQEVIGRKAVEYCKQYEESDKYNVAMLAIEFGYQLALQQEQDKNKYSEDIWIPISEIKTVNPQGNILIWQENLSDKECSRFQRAIWYETFIEVYPLTNRTLFKLNDVGCYQGYDLEGDLCRVTYFAIINEPKKIKKK